MAKTPKLRMGGLQAMSKDGGKAQRRAERKRKMNRPGQKTAAISEASKSLGNGEKFIKTYF